MIDWLLSLSELRGQTCKLIAARLLGLGLVLVQKLVRRAKLGSASRGKKPAPKALVRHRVPSVASAVVTLTAKRTQGDDGLQCESVKGLSPDMD